MGLTKEQRKQREAAEAQKRRADAWKWLVMLDDALRPVPLPKPEKFGAETAGWAPLVPSSWWNVGVSAEQRWQSTTAEYNLYATETEALLAGCYKLKDVLCEHIATTLDRMEGK